MNVIPFVRAMWMGVFAVWAISALLTKQTVTVRSSASAHLSNWVVGLGWWIVLTGGFQQPFLMRRWLPDSPVVQGVGLVVTAISLAFCLWARFYLGRNWSAVITVTENHQLIRTGPYGIVRHPIYSGFMFATLGTAIAFGQVAGLVALALIVTAWGYKASLEEAAMAEQFGAEYDAYRRDVKGLIPYIR
jgi:protein-S-isoprenylcysteine O-methyltransferase Ste14